MRRTLATMTTAMLGAFTALCVWAGPAMGGEFRVATCQSDKLENATTAFEVFVKRGTGMLFHSDCRPRRNVGVLTGNKVSAADVKQGVQSVAAISTPPGTHITEFVWRGAMEHPDCRYAVELFAELLDGDVHLIKYKRANRQCERPRSGARAAATTMNVVYKKSNFDPVPARRIVQRVICRAPKTCSARGRNYVRTLEAELRIVDAQPPTATIMPDTPLATGAWVRGVQPLSYDARDNVGVKLASAFLADRDLGSHKRVCPPATDDGAFANPVPCPSGAGTLSADTRIVDDGTRPLILRAEDAAKNLGDSAPVMARIDNTPPPQVPVNVVGGEQWRNHNNFALAWVNPDEGDRAPIVSAIYKLCSASGDSCGQGDRVESNIAGLPVQVPRAGEWKASVWRRDEAGNEDASQASPPVTLRYDPDAPRLVFEPTDPADPTALAVQVTDALSGVADGSIEIGRAGSNTWQVLDTQKVDGRLVARIDDAALPPGDYVLRSTARDLAGNEGSTTARLDGQQMTLTLPLRIASVMQVGAIGKRTVRRVVRVNGKRRTVVRRVIVLGPSAGVRFGKTAQIKGRLANRDGQGIPDAEMQVLSRTDASAEQLVGTVRTDAAGNYAYTAAGSTSRVLRFAYHGSPLILPAQGEVGLRVPATSTLRASRTRLVNGQSVAFMGRVRTLPVPSGGKLVELQVLLSGRWQTFRTGRTDQAGDWRLTYRFARTRTNQRFRFRLRLPREAGYPYESGGSRPLDVLVRGR